MLKEIFALDKFNVKQGEIRSTGQLTFNDFVNLLTFPWKWLVNFIANVYFCTCPIIANILWG